MFHRMNFLRIVLLLASVLTVAVLAGCAAGNSDSAFVRDTGDPADALVESKCSMCHTTERIFAASKTVEEWEATMQRMKRNGLVISDLEFNQILVYLGKQGG